MKHRKFVILFIVYSISFIILVSNATLPDELRTIERSLEFQTIVDVEKNDLFSIMANVEKYPLILPDSYVSVKILDKKDNYIIALETVKEAGIQTTFKVKHTFIENESHEITILEGDAKNSNIVVWFTDYSVNKTQISIESNLQLKGIMAPFGIVPDGNFHHALNTILDMFIEYEENKINN